MKVRKRFLTLFAFLLATQLSGQLRDTILYSMTSRPFFYNVLKAGDGRIFTGTSEGIFLIDGVSISKFNDQAGYLTLDKNGLPIIDPDGIKYHNETRYSRMLPFPTEIRDEYHAGSEAYFYITSGGRLHIYEILLYEHSYRNHSVRSASRNFVGTYSGIYYRGIKIGADMRFPGFTDGHIREMNGKAFICYSSLIIADLHQGDSLPVARTILPRGFNFDWVNDIHYSKLFKQYFVSARSKLITINKELTEAKALFNLGNKDADLVLLNENRNYLYFGAGKNLMSIYPKNLQIQFKYTLPETILDGYISNSRKYLLCREGLYAINEDGSSKKLVTLKQAHTLQHLGGSDFVISTNAGLYRYNSASNKLSELIKGVEFNRRGLYLQGDSLFAGSIDGLYILDVKQLDRLAERAGMTSEGNRTLSDSVLMLIAALISCAAALSLMLYRSRRRIKAMEDELPVADAPKINREVIETFITENLAQASLKSIAEQFKTNNAVIYTALAPEKPGALINRLRMEQVKKLRKAGKSAADISQLTGFSEYYVRKVWNK